MHQPPALSNRSSNIDVLLVEDSAADADLVREALSDSSVNSFQITQAGRLSDALARLQDHDYDIVLLDLSLPDQQGLRTLQQARGAASGVPIVVMTGLDDEAIALKAVQSGAQDYLVKGEVESRNLPRTLRHAIERHQMFMELKRSHEREHYLATRDPLTGLPNRQLFFDHLGQALAHADRRRQSFAILFLDIDHFKNINDSLGHAVGDQLLQQLARRLSSCLRLGDAAARLGGDEFTIMMSDLPRVQDVARVAEKVIGALSQPCVIENHELCVTASIGIALYPGDGQDYRTLIENADAAMYTAKDQGRNTYRFYTPAMNALARARLLLENKLRGALKRDELRVYYQPEVQGVTGEIIGAEALLRWQLPGRGVLLPADFIVLAEETGLIVPISEWVLRMACAQNKAWQRAGYPRIRVAVNLSACQLRRNDLEATVAKALSESGLDAASLELEVPERRMTQEAGLDAESLRRLKKIGVRLAIDDFGTGYSSFSALKSLPVDVLKIDQSFVHDITSDPQGAAITAAMIDLAGALGLDCVAEGVETLDQREFLESHNCSHMQGYLFSHPVPPEEFTGLWTRNIERSRSNPSTKVHRHRKSLLMSDSS